MRDSTLDGTGDLEARLVEESRGVRGSGLTDDEVHLVALARLTRSEPSLRRAARDRGLELLDPSPDGGTDAAGRSGAGTAIVLAVIAAGVVQVVRLLVGLPESLPGWLVRSASLLVLPLLALLLARRRDLGAARTLGALGPFALAALVVNVMPLPDGSASQALVATHLPLALWFAAVRPIAGGGAGGHGRYEGRLQAVRFTGEWFVALVLLALGGAVFIGLTALLLTPFGDVVVEQAILWILPSGAAGAVIVAAWLVDSGVRFTAAVGPVLVAVFTPLFAVMLVAAAVSHAATGAFTRFDRETLVLFDVLLVVVLALVAYGTAIRGSGRGRTDRVMSRVRLVAVVAAVTLDGMVLVSMIARVVGLGATPNRVAALGLNVVLLGVLAGAAWSGARAVARGEDEERVARWLGASLPALAAWFVAVVIVVPLAFGSA